MSLPTLLVKGNLVPTLAAGDPNLKDSQNTLNQEIPIDYVMQWIKDRFPGIGRPENDTPTIVDRVLILRSKTGSGKSTIIPPMLFKNFIFNTEGEKRKPGIIITEPRVITAKELASDVADKSYFVPLELGQNIGYTTGSLIERSRYGISYTTIGILLQQLRMRDDELILRKYRFIIIDETHDRSNDTDQVFYLLKAFMQRVLPNPRAPFIILMSATFDPPIYARFFGVYQEDSKQLAPKLYGQTNIIDVSGFAYSVKFNWLTRSSANYAADMARIVLDIHKNNTKDDPKNKDILIFIPGAMDMDNVISAIKKIGEIPKDLLVLKLESNAIENKTNDYLMSMAPYDKLPTGITRRLILSTNVAEIGITIETLHYVLDYGWNKATEFNPECCIDELIEKPAPKSRILQRKGRAGRKYPGEFDPIYTEDTFNVLSDIQLPAILESDFTPMLMNIAAITTEFNIIADVIEKMLEVPSGPALCIAVSKLCMIGFIEPLADLTADDKKIKNISPEFKITALGDIASKFSKLRLETVRMILNGYIKYTPMPQINGEYIEPKIAILDLITLAAIIEDRSDIMRNMKIDKLNNLLSLGTPKWFCEDADMKKVWDLCRDEMIIYLFVFNSVIMALNNSEPPHDWAESNNVNINTFSSIAKTRNAIMENMINIGLDVNHNEKYSVIHQEANIKPAEFIQGVKRAIQSGFVMNTMEIIEEGRPRYLQQYVNSKSEGVNNFKLRYEEAIMEYAKDDFPQRVIPLKIGMQQMHNKDGGFSESMPVIKMICVLDDHIIL